MIGRLNERITFQSYTTVSDGAGGRVTTWANLGSVPTVWASVKAKSGTEGFSEGRTNAEATYTFIVRQRSDLDERMRIVWRSENYDVTAIMRSGNHPQYLIIEAERET